jgi:hypothetical protein
MFDLPEFVVRAGKSFLVINARNVFDETQKIKITLENLARYYAEEACSMSGLRTLAGLSGDWRPIDELASFALDYFKSVNVVGMRKVGRKFGLEPKF